jgi:hypothetical protein
MARALRTLVNAGLQSILRFFVMLSIALISEHRRRIRIANITVFLRQ